MRMRPVSMLSASLGITLLLSACGSTQPKPYTKEEQQLQISADKATMYEDQEPVIRPITFYEAAARALKYNLDYRLKLMESALSAKLRDVSSHEMLPRIVAGTGIAARSNDSGGTSIGIEDRQVSLRPSTSEERFHMLSNLGLSWSLLDFGVAYYRTQQRSDQILMAEERRRKVAQNVLQDVRNAYWRALAAQRLKPEVDRLLERTQKALGAAREAEQKGLMPRQQILAYQRALLDSVYLLTIRRQDLELSQAELAALMSLPPGVPMVLAEMPEQVLPQQTVEVGRLEQLSLENRPEIAEEWYRKRVNANDLKVAKAQLWPNIGLDAGLQYDTNTFLYNNYWSQIGLTVSVNLVKLLQYPLLNATQDAQAHADDMRRVALSMAILTQVRVGLLRYRLALQEMQFAEDGLRVDTSLLDYARAAQTTTFGSELELIRSEGRYLLSRYQREAAYSNAQAAWGRLYNSIGFDIMPEAIERGDIATLASEIERTVNRQEQTNLLVIAQGAPNAEAARP